jgi:beta-glucosidase
MAQEGEDIDRPSMDLPFAQAALVRAVAAANKNTVVVLNNGTPVTMKDWVAQVPGIVETWLPGMEGGNALAAILFGDVNPSGKLPTTLGLVREDYPDTGNFPGTDGVENYAEGIFVGYRHFDQANIAPAFPFGFGLSYTTFAYSNLKLGKTAIGPTDRITATVDITNTGTRAGEEVAELYVHDPAPKIEKAPRELKGFAKIALAPGETKTVRFDLPLRALAYCDVPGKQWKADAGSYEIEVGASSRDLPQKATLQLSADYTEAIPGMR